MKTNILSWLQEGNITVPAVLFSEYRNMNLNEYELVLLLNIITFLEKEMTSLPQKSFPHV